MSKRAKQRKNHKGYSFYTHRSSLLENPLLTIKRTKRNIIHAYQRLFYGYCDKDVWDMDIWFLNVVPRMLQDLRDKNDGYPAEIGSIVGIDDYIASRPTELENRAINLWENTLDEMIHLFSEANTEWSTESYDEWQQHRNNCKDKAFDLFKRWFFCLWN